MGAGQGTRTTPGGLEPFVGDTSELNEKKSAMVADRHRDMAKKFYQAGLPFAVAKSANTPSDGGIYC